MKIKHINALDLAIVIAIFEFFALIFIWLLNVDNTVVGNLWLKLLNGFLIGIFTTVPAIIIFNNSPLKIRFDKFVIKKLNLLSFMLANGLFLAAMFFVESIISSLKLFNLLLGNMVVGFITNFVIIILLINFYNKQPFKLVINQNNKIETASPLNAAILVGIIEACILPIMVSLFLISDNVLWYGISGLISGFVGVYLAIQIYDLIFSKKLCLKIKISS